MGLSPSSLISGVPLKDLSKEQVADLVVGIGSAYQGYRDGILGNDVTGSDICDLEDKNKVADLFGAVGIENEFHQNKIIKLFTSQSVVASSPTVSSAVSNSARITEWQHARAMQQAEYEGSALAPKCNPNMAAWQRFWTTPACMQPCCYISNCGTTMCKAPPPKSAACRGNSFMRPPDAEFFLCMHGRTTAELSLDACRGQWCGPCFHGPGSFHAHDTFLRVDAHGEHTIIRRVSSPLVTGTHEWVAADAPALPLDMLSPEEIAEGCQCGCEFTEELPPAIMPFCPRKHARHILANSNVFAPLHAECLVLNSKIALGQTVVMTIGEAHQSTTPFALCPTCIHEDKVDSISRDFDAGLLTVAAAWTAAKQTHENAWLASTAAAYDALHAHVRPAALAEANWRDFVAAVHDALRDLHPQELYRQLAERATAAAAEWTHCDCVNMPL